MNLKIFYIFCLFIGVLNIVSSKSTKCCQVNQILNSTFNGCTSVRNISNISFNISDFNATASFYNISSKVINLPCDTRQVKVLLSDEFEIFENLTLNPRIQVGAENFYSSEYCLDDAVDVDGKVALTCSCLRGTCVNVCCQPGYVVDQNMDISDEFRLNCIPADQDEWKYWRLENSSITAEQQLYHTVYGSEFKCENSEQTVIESSGNVTLLANGILREFSAESNAVFQLEPSEYCIGVINFFNITGINMIVCGIPQEVNIVTISLYIILHIIGAIFLLATLVVHIMLPELRRSVQGLSLMSHCAWMLIAHISLTIVQVVGATVTDIPCKILAYLVQISLLAAFFWMNVMCVDISLKFRRLRTTDTNISEEIRKFLFYSIYAIGVPVLIFIITIAVDSSDNIDINFKPLIGNETCWFPKESYGIVIYFYGPIGLLLLFNFLLFLFTTRKIVTFSRGTSILQRSNVNNTQRHKDTKSFMLFLKLFGLMGIPWIMEIISWAVGGKDYYWYLTDAFNLLRSVFIFIMFCCKKKVRKLLHARYHWISTAILQRNTPESSSSDQQNQEVRHSTQEDQLPETNDTINLTPIQNQRQQERQ